MIDTDIDQVSTIIRNKITIRNSDDSFMVMTNL